VIAAVAELERSLNRERVAMGLNKARLSSFSHLASVFRRHTGYSRPHVVAYQHSADGPIGTIYNYLALHVLL
jgi:hypothetical protein